MNWRVEGFYGEIEERHYTYWIGGVEADVYGSWISLASVDVSGD
jgi:hypothetical protein